MQDESAIDDAVDARVETGAEVQLVHRGGRGGGGGDQVADVAHVADGGGRAAVVHLESDFSLRF